MRHETWRAVGEYSSTGLSANNGDSADNAGNADQKARELLALRPLCVSSVLQLFAVRLYLSTRVYECVETCVSRVMLLSEHTNRIACWQLRWPWTRTLYSSTRCTP